MNLDTIREKLFSTFNPESGYTMEDFQKEMNELGFENSNGMSISFVNNSTNEDPAYATEEAAGFDLRANDSLILESGEFKVVKTGLFFDLPLGFEMQIRPRSGLAAKYGVTVLNAPGTIDSDYVGEIGVILINHGKESFVINQGDRIAQAVISPVTGKRTINLERVSKIDKETERGAGGFGSTGRQ